MKHTVYHHVTTQEETGPLSHARPRDRGVAIPLHPLDIWRRAENAAVLLNVHLPRHRLIPTSKHPHTRTQYTHKEYGGTASNYQHAANGSRPGHEDSRTASPAQRIGKHVVGFGRWEGDLGGGKAP